MKYDFYTRKLLRTVLKQDSNCMDVGAHKGEILDLMLHFAPHGKHNAFEPIPAMYEALKKNYKGKASVYAYALSDENGSATFQVVENAPEYSGLQKRNYGSIEPRLKEISVVTKKLDDAVDPSQRIDLIKIDVEGAELKVLKGAVNSLQRWKPYVVFEFGIGAADHYGSNPEEMYDLFEKAGMVISSLSADFFQNKFYTRDQFVNCYNRKEHYYFVGFNRSIRGDE